MFVETFPSFDLFPAKAKKHTLTMALPKETSKRVTIKVPLE
jgi:hypothetical protein